MTWTLKAMANLNPRAFSHCFREVGDVSSTATGVVWSSEKATLEKVSPLLKVETAARPATIRLRIDDMRAVQAAAARSTGSPKPCLVPDRISPWNSVWNSVLQRTINACRAYGSIDWTVPPETQPKAIVGRPTNWERIESLRGIRHYPLVRDVRKGDLGHRR